MGFVQRLGPRRFKARYRGPDGRERARTFERKADAARFLSSVETDKARGEWSDPRLARVSLADWAGHWLGTTVHLKPKTRAGYESLLRAHVLPAFGRSPMGGIQPVEVRRWPPCGAAAVTYCVPALEIVESVAEVGGKLHLGETKTYQRRTVVIPRFLRDLLAEHLAGQAGDGRDSFVFSGRAGGLLRNSNFRQRVWQPAVRALGLPSDLRIHDLRHTCAALLIAQGAHPKAIQAQLGHSSIQVTLDLYGHLFPDDMDRLASQLDAAHEAASGQIAASVRPGDAAEVVELPVGRRKSPPEQGVSEWGGLDSNQRPTDYEGGGTRVAWCRPVPLSAATCARVLVPSGAVPSVWLCAVR